MLVILHICAKLALVLTVCVFWITINRYSNYGLFMVKRVNVTLSDDHYDILKSYAAVVGRSPTRFGGGYVD